MTEHLSECPILKPCCGDQEFPEHGFCGNFVGGRCLHCMAECICDALRACEERVLNAAREAVAALTAGRKRMDYEDGPEVYGAHNAYIDCVRDALAAIKGDQQ